MNRVPTFAALAAVLLSILAASPGHAEDGPPPIDPAKSAAFNIRMFGAPIGKKAAYACFVRRYDEGHLAQHPLQKVAEMKLLVKAQDLPKEQSSAYSFQLGVKYRNRKTAYDSSGYCRHVVAQDDGNELRFGCGVECDGGGIEMALPKDDKDNKSVTVRLERVRIWRHSSNPDPESGTDLDAGDDDKMFRLERADASECTSLVTDRKALAALRRK
jgi:hypothetical protein